MSLSLSLSFFFLSRSYIPTLKLILRIQCIEEEQFELSSLSIYLSFFLFSLHLGLDENIMAGGRLNSFQVRLMSEFFLSTCLVACWSLPRRLT